MYSFRVLTDDGRELGLLKVQHRMDLQGDRRDRLMFESDLVYGRDGRTVFVEMHGNARPSRVSDARDELEILGLLARFPWCFADTDRFLVEDPEEVRYRGRELTYKIHVESRVAAGELGSARKPERPDVYEIYCDESMLPFRMAYTLAAAGSERVVQFSDYRNYGRGTRIPALRQFLDSKERPTLEIGIQLLTTGVKLHAAEFQPSR